MQAPMTLYYWPTPNGWKISIALEEMNLPYDVKLIDISKREQHAPSFLRVSPNNRIPAILDPHGPDGAPISIFESGAILRYLARKTSQFGGSGPRAAIDVDVWLMWQMSGVGPMAGQAHHFLKFAPTDLPYAKQRYVNEVARLYGVLDRRLAQHEFVAGEYSIADMAIWPWASLWAGQQQTLDDKPHFARWLKTVWDRPAVKRGRALHMDKRRDPTPDIYGHSLKS
ncbi:MAG: glutathione S-transferase N-terminal domain-containing protein [Rhodobacteraceae bacterium]|nr:glutathione S-transferase N-terminal domain-containing protein [Paracoccaceae bacterium]